MVFNFENARRLPWFFALAGIFLLSGCGDNQYAKEMAAMQPEQKLFFHDNHLSTCPNSPNCVNSETDQEKSFIPPLAVTGSPEQAWQALQAVIVDKGGSMETVSEEYLHATFRSRVFRFVDDLVCRLDRENRVIHVRSSARTGYSDFGVNRKRVEMIRGELQLR